MPDIHDPNPSGNHTPQQRGEGPKIDIGFEPEFVAFVDKYVADNPGDPLVILLVGNQTVKEALLALEGAGQLPIESIFNTMAVCLQHLLQVSGYLLSAGVAAVATDEEEYQWNLPRYAGPEVNEL